MFPRKTGNGFDKKEIRKGFKLKKEEKNILVLGQHWQEYQILYQKYIVFKTPLDIF